MTNQEQPDTRHLDPCFSCDDRRDSHYDGGCVGSCANECNGFEEYPYAPPAPDTQSGGRPTLAERARDEALAALFHAVYERLAPQYGYETRSESAVPWSQVPENNKRLMIAVAAEVGSAIRAESSAALQEARDRADLAERNQDTLARGLERTVDAREDSEATAGQWQVRALAAESTIAGLRAEVVRVRALIDLDRTGLALGLSEVRRIVRGHEWLADPEGGRGSYTDDEWDEAAIRREVNDLITGVDEAALKALTESGYRADAAYREPLTDAEVARLGLVGIAAGLREQISAQDRELSALSSDKQTLMTAVTHWREQVEGLRAALTEWRWLADNRAGGRYGLWPHRNGCRRQQHSGACDCGVQEHSERLAEAERALAPAATRPVPASLSPLCKTCGKGDRDRAHDGQYGRSDFPRHPFAPDRAGRRTMLPTDARGDA